MIVMAAEREPVEIPDSMRVIKRDQGIACPDCGCRHWLTTKTAHKGAAVNRLRTCRHCGKKVRTAEKFVEGRQ